MGVVMPAAGQVSFCRQTLLKAQQYVPAQHPLPHGCSVHPGAAPSEAPPLDEPLLEEAPPEELPLEEPPPELPLDVDPPSVDEGVPVDPPQARTLTRAKVAAKERSIMSLLKWRQANGVPTSGGVFRAVHTAQGCVPLH
jgi:hypothetical protein